MNLFSAGHSVDPATFGVCLAIMGAWTPGFAACRDPLLKWLSIPFMFIGFALVAGFIVLPDWMLN